ncbi:MAG: hypothetical protein RPS47_05135 [Colwellia sp.]|jgi:hypothetical protein
MKILMIVAALMLTATVQAKESEGERLIQGCSELVGIYKNKSEKRFLASQLASSSDALLAGYCMGVIKAYKQLANPRVYYEQVKCGYGVRGPCHKVKEVTLCKHDDWFEIAEAVASYWKIKKVDYSVNELLEDVCNG